LEAAGKVFAISRQAAGEPHYLCQSRSFWSTQMKHKRHIEASTTALREARQTRTLIADIDRIVQILNIDIAAEEEQAWAFDPTLAEYPMLARTLTARRDNLRATIAALEQRLLNLPTELLETA
jgi:hypothetical protein